MSALRQEQEKVLPDVPDQDVADPSSTSRGLVSAFLNIPYDDAFQSLYLAYVAGITSFGLVPRATLEIPGGARRLDRIFDLIKSCRYSFHDLSRVELDARRRRTALQHAFRTWPRCGLGQAQTWPTRVVRAGGKSPEITKVTE